MSLRIVSRVSADFVRVNPFCFGHLLSDQAISLYFVNRFAKNDRFSVLGSTFQGQKHGCKDFGLQATPPATTRQVASSYDPTGWYSLSS